MTINTSSPTTPGIPSVDVMIAALIAREGGFVNDPDDPGGATKFGITIATLSAYRGYGVTVEQVSRLTATEAAEIYRDKYLLKPKIAMLPDALVPCVFDMYVNSGANAIRILQRVLNEFASFMGIAPLSVDGLLGPVTLGYALRIHNAAGQFLIDAYGIARRDYYYGLADRRPSSRKYARTQAGGKGGWIKRAEEFLSSRYHYSARQHALRVSDWGV